MPGKNLFDVDEAIGKGSIVMNLLSDAAQSETWPAIKPALTKGKVSIRLIIWGKWGKKPAGGLTTGLT